MSYSSTNRRTFSASSSPSMPTMTIRRPSCWLSSSLMTGAFPAGGDQAVVVGGEAPGAAPACGAEDGERRYGYDDERREGGQDEHDHPVGARRTLLGGRSVARHA